MSQAKITPACQVCDGLRDLTEYTIGCGYYCKEDEPMSQTEKVRYTPGPWKANEATGEIKGANLTPVCRVLLLDHTIEPQNENDAGYKIRNKEAEANARLIAAAVDLLEACRNIIDAMEVTGLTQQLFQASEQIKEAVAKATEKE